MRKNFRKKTNSNGNTKKYKKIIGRKMMEKQVNKGYYVDIEK